MISSSPVRSHHGGQEGRYVGRVSHGFPCINIMHSPVCPCYARNRSHHMAYLPLLHDFKLPRQESSWWPRGKLCWQGVPWLIPMPDHHAFARVPLLCMLWQLTTGVTANVKHTCPPAPLPSCPPAHLPTCPPAHLPTCPPAHLPTCPPAHLPTCPPAHLPTCPYLPSCLAAQLPSCPAAQLPSCPAAQLPSCPADQLTS
eukprot:jgi/Mesvir1/28240/Mv26210-RA.1